MVTCAAPIVRATDFYSSLLNHNGIVIRGKKGNDGIHKTKSTSLDYLPKINSPVTLYSGSLH